MNETGEEGGGEGERKRERERLRDEEGIGA